MLVPGPWSLVPGPWSLVLVLVASLSAYADSDPAVVFQVPEVPPGVTAEVANSYDDVFAQFTVQAGVRVTDVESRMLDSAEAIIDTRFTDPADAALGVVDGFEAPLDLPLALVDGAYAQQVVVTVEYLESGATDTHRATRFFAVDQGVLQPLTRREFSARVLPTFIALDATGAWVEHVAGADVGDTLGAATPDGGEGDGVDEMVESGDGGPDLAGDTASEVE